MLFYLFFITQCNAMIHNHPSKYKIINGEAYINYYTLNGYTGLQKMDNNCEDYDYNFNNINICCDYHTIIEIKYFLYFNKNISINILKRRLINSLRNTPNSWVKINQNNLNYTFTFMTNEMFFGDEDNLLEEFKYINNLKNYKKNKKEYYCKKSKFELIQEVNDTNFMNFILILSAVCIFCNIIFNICKNINNCYKEKYSIIN